MSGLTGVMRYFNNQAHDFADRLKKIEKFETAYRKFCRGCSTTKEINEFYKSKYHTGGYRPRCKKCVIKYSTERKQRMRKSGEKDATINDRLFDENTNLKTIIQKLCDALDEAAEGLEMEGFEVDRLRDIAQQYREKGK